MALQFGFGLEKFGGKLYIPKVTSLSIIREMGPVFTSLINYGTTASGIVRKLAPWQLPNKLMQLVRLEQAQSKN